MDIRLELVRKIRKNLKTIAQDVYELCQMTDSTHNAWIEHSIKLLQKSLYKLQEELEQKEFSQ